MSFLNKFLIKLTNKLVAKDGFGNEYYESKSVNYLGKKARSVIYAGDPEPSKVPPIFHAWLHNLSDELQKPDQLAFDWQKAYSPNMTGTNLAYSPVNETGRKNVSSDYQAWKPNK